MKRVLALCLVGLFGCSRTDVSTPTPTPVPVATTSVTATPAPLGPQMPPPTFTGFPGWLGLAAVEGPGSDTTAPANANAHVALTDPAGWAATGGARLLVLAPGHSEQVGYFTTQEIPFGCEGRKETFAFFKGKTRPPRGPVWLVSGGNVSVTAAVLTEDVKKTPTSRTWTIGERTFVSRLTETAIVWEIWEGKTRVWQEVNKWTPMAGADDLKPSLEGGPAAPIPRMVLTADDTSLLVIEMDGFEGTNIQGILLEKGSAKRAEGGLYLYWCAF